MYAKIGLNVVWWKDMAGFIWLKNGQVVRHCEHGHEPTVSKKMRVTIWLSEELLSSQEKLYPTLSLN